MKSITPMEPEEALRYVDTIHCSMGRNIGKTLQIRFLSIARIALERMAKKEPVKVITRPFEYKCPTCQVGMKSDEVVANNCRWCGQRFDWSKAKEKEVKKDGKNSKF